MLISNDSSVHHIRVFTKNTCKHQWEFYNPRHIYPVVSMGFTPSKVYTGLQLQYSLTSYLQNNTLFCFLLKITFLF